MTVLYADTSAVVRAFLPDEPDHAALLEMLVDGAEPVITSELTWLEFASAVSAAARARRVDAPELLLDEFAGACAAEDGPLTLLALRIGPALDLAHDLVRRHRLGTLDALHLAVALTDGADLAGAEGLAFVTRDTAQAEVAQALGLQLR